MTIEDIKDICRIYDNFRREQDAATLVYNSEDAFWEHILTTYNLTKFFIPPDELDEAAEEYCSKCREKGFALSPYSAFKAGAKWMANTLISCARQSAVFTNKLDADKYIPHVIDLLMKGGNQ